MSKKIKLTRDITEQAFDNGYWYADELKAFAKELGIAHSAKLRKDELEKLIKNFIRTGKIASVPRKNLVSKGIKDHEVGLTLALPIHNYTNNKETKHFIEQEALKIKPTLKEKSGTRYRLNRWREQQIMDGRKITYGDLINEYIRLNESTKAFPKIPQVRYINFLAEYLAHEKDATRDEAIKAWKHLKELDVPKDYASWKRIKKAN